MGTDFFDGLVKTFSKTTKELGKTTRELGARAEQTIEAQKIRSKITGEERIIEKIKVDIGDIVGFTGTIRRTPRGELSIKSTELTLLSKALLPLPNKQISKEKAETLSHYHGLTDVELKYRQRYVDLIVNEESRDTFRKRSMIVQKVREFLAKQGYMEVETPILQTMASAKKVLNL